MAKYPLPATDQAGSPIEEVREERGVEVKEWGVRRSEKYIGTNFKESQVEKKRLEST